MVSDSATALVDAFYSTLLSDAEAGPRLSHEIVSTRLSSAMKGWLRACSACATRAISRR